MRRRIGNARAPVGGASAGAGGHITCSEVRFGSDDGAHRFAVAGGLADVDEVVAADTLHNLAFTKNFGVHASKPLSF